MSDHLFDHRRLAQVGRGELDRTDARALQRAAGDDIRRLRRSIYTSSGAWDVANRAERHLMQVNAVEATRRIRPVFGHLSAAVFWGIPVGLSGAEPVHVIVPRDSAARSKNGVAVHRHPLDSSDVREIGGLLVTSPLRTVVDLARNQPFLDAVIALDFVLHPRRSLKFPTVSRDLLLEEWDRVADRPGSVRALRAIEFARAGADNPGESTSRVVIDRLGFPPPELQVQHRNPRGAFYYTDTEWPEFRAIGEFDGKGKYLKDDYLRGMAPGEAVYEEKVREDHLRDEGNRVARWGWPELRDPPQLERKLLAAGVRRVSDRRPGRPR